MKILHDWNLCLLFYQKTCFYHTYFEVWTAYKFCLDSNNETNFWKNDCNTSDNFTNMFKKLCSKYHDFFNIQKADQLAFYQITNHAIKLKFDIEFSYMHIYNMFSAELKTLKNYINNSLVKK